MLELIAHFMYDIPSAKSLAKVLIISVILTPTNDSDPKETLVATVNDAAFGDAYVRTPAYVDSPSDVGNVELIIRYDPFSISGYIGVIDNGSGYLTMALIEFGQITFQWEQIVLD
ncbi:MAG: hypothetical protein JW829_16220, partial [Pirellulales bacterium]|nr:hypothetical protein [Pirellulales bacterium]